MHLSRYLGVYLPGQSGCSINTVRSYRDTFSLFLRFCQNECKLNPQKLTLEQVDRHLIENFLHWLETDRGCSAGTQNNRLAAIHAFYRYLQEDVRLSSPTVIRLTGKGGKSRFVPIMAPTENLLRTYLEEHDSRFSLHGGFPLFRNRDGKKLTRAGIAYILSKYVKSAQQLGDIPAQMTISPHVLRHSKAMHLLQSGVNLIYIRDLLGHADVSTTEIYARADEHFKRQALTMAYPSPTPEPETPVWQKDSDLLNWLKNLGR